MYVCVCVCKLGRYRQSQWHSVTQFSGYAGINCLHYTYVYTTGLLG